MNSFFFRLIKFSSLDKKGQSSVCINRQSFNGYTFNKFYCPLPPSTGMNQLDRFCCGIANYQYCCNEQFVLPKILFEFILTFVFFLLIENTIEIKPVDMMMMVLIIAIHVIPDIDITHEQIELWLLFYQLLVFLLQQER
jgi:hypothetical protein